MTDARPEENDLLYKRLIAATAERIVDQRVRTAPLSSNLPKKLIRSPKYYLQVEQDFVSLLVYPSSDDVDVSRRIRQFASPVPCLYQTRQRMTTKASLLIKRAANPIVVVGNPMTLRLAGDLGSLFLLEEDARFALVGVTADIYSIKVKYEIPLFLAIAFGNRFRIGNAAEALENLASVVISSRADIPRDFNQHLAKKN